MSNLSFLEFILLALLFGAIDTFIPALLHMFYAKKCKYDCSKCRNWDCMIDYCNRKREELKK